MIERVLVNGADVDLGDVLAEVSIRHGRGSIDDGPMASTASLTLVNVDRALVAAFSAGDRLDLLLADDVSRFRGRVTDAAVSETGLAVIAVSSMSWLSRRTVGNSDWPSESWRDRLERVFQDAGIALTWGEIPGTWAASGGLDWGEAGFAGRLTIDAVDDGPMLADRVSSGETLGGYLAGEFHESEPAVAANLPDGSVLIQQLRARAAKAEFVPDPAAVAFPPSWMQADEVENSLALEYDDGSDPAPRVYAENADSIVRFEVRPVEVVTALTNATDANERAQLRVLRRGFPRWLADSVTLLNLEPGISIGTPVRLTNLPPWAPDSAYLGIVEGWEDSIAPDALGDLAWNMVLSLSDPRLSGGFGTLWFTAPGKWSETGTTTWLTADDLGD